MTELPQSPRDNVLTSAAPIPDNLERVTPYSDFMATLSSCSSGKADPPQAPTRRRIRYLSVLLEGLTLRERLHLLGLVSLRSVTGLCDLLLALAMYFLFLLLQGHALPRLHGRMPESVVGVAVATAALILLRSTLEMISLRAVVKHTHRIYETLVLRLACGYTEMQWTSFAERNRGDLLNLTVNTAAEAAHFCQFCIEFASSLVVVMAMLIALIYKSPAITLWILATTTAFCIFHRFFVREQLRAAGVKKDRSLQHLQRSLIEMFSLGKEIRTYANHEFFYQRVREHTGSLSKAMRRLMLIPQIARILSDQGVVLAFALMVITVELRHGDVQRTLSLLVFYFVLSRRFLPLVSQLSFIAGQMAGLSESAQTVRRELAETVQNCPPVLSPRDPETGLVLELRAVGFRFYGRNILHNLSLRQRSGETIVIRGESGKGKTTLLNIIAGVTQPDEGEVHVNRSSVAYVPQETVLLDDSIRNNLLFGALRKADEELQRAIAIAELDDLVASLPMGLETRVGDNGILLSGGQRQRLGLARAILRNATLLLLDEATSALDEPSESQVLKNLRKLNVAVLMVTHRIHSHRFGDRELSLREGMLVEDNPLFTSLSRNPAAKRSYIPAIW